MSNRLNRKVALPVILITLFLIQYGTAEANQCVPPTNAYAYRIYYHNSGLDTLCVQDCDLDLVEFFDFLDNYPIVSDGSHLIVDHFDNDCMDPSYTPHGEIVYDYFEYASDYTGISTEEMNDFDNYCEIMRYIINNYDRGTVVNLSNGPDCITPTERCFKHGLTPIDTLYKQGILLVGAPMTFCSEVFSKRLKDMVISTIITNGEGDFCAGSPEDTNVVQVGVQANWEDDEAYYIAKPGSSPDWSQGWEGEFGSFSTPLLSGTLSRVMDVVSSRSVPDSEVVDRVLDYVISSCDRNEDPETYARYTNAMLKSYGPWSTVWGYGMYNPWKAMIYAYGYGSLEAADTEMDSGVDNPPMVFSDHFYLRGDLFVPAGQTLEVCSMGSISIDPDVSSPEGPENIGFYDGKQDILIAGEMEVATDLLSGVCASLVIDDGGSCTVKNGGLISIKSGQILYIRQGGELNIENGGEVIIYTGGLLAIDGDLNNNGTISYPLGGGKSVELSHDIIDAGTGNSTGGDSLMGCPEGDWLALKVTLDFNKSQDGSELSLSTDSQVKFWGDTTADSSATSTNSYITTITRKYVSVDRPCQSSCDDCPAHTIQILYNGFEIGQVIDLPVKSPDYNGDGYVNLSDFSFFGDTYNKSSGDEGYNDCFDFNFDQSVSSADYPLFVSHYTHNYSGGYQSSAGRIASASETGVLIAYSGEGGNSADIYLEDVEDLSAMMLGFKVEGSGISCSGWKPNGAIGNTEVTEIEGENLLYLSGYEMGGITGSMVLLGTIEFSGDGLAADGVRLSLSTGEIGRSDGTVEVIAWEGAEEISGPVLAGNRLRKIYPNPFNPSTTIEYSVETPARVSLSVFNVEGRLVKRLVSEHQRSGVYRVNWNGKDSRGNPVSSGIYFCRISIGSYDTSRKMILMR